MIAGIVIASIIGTIALILCIPLYGLIEVRVEEQPRIKLMLSWLFGAFKRQIPASKEKPVEIENGSNRRMDGGWFKLFEELFTDSEQRARVGKLLYAVVRSGKVENLEADFRIGLEDPVDTALILGPAGAASVLLNVYTDYNVWVIPALEGEICQGYFYVRFRWRPIRLFRPVVDFLASKTGRRIVKQALSRR